MIHVTRETLLLATQNNLVVIIKIRHVNLNFCNTYGGVSMVTMTWYTCIFDNIQQMVCECIFKLITRWYGNDEQVECVCYSTFWMVIKELLPWLPSSEPFFISENIFIDVSTVSQICNCDKIVRWN
jgi:hypothetical protein